MNELIKIKDLPKKFGEDLVAEMQHSMICLGHACMKEKRVSPCGSGTLVRRGGIHGILTAAHVVHELRDKDEVALFLTKGRGLFTFDRGTPIFSECVDARFSEEGPDIGFIQIPNAKVGTIGAVKSFVNLDNQAAKIEGGQPDLDGSLWCATGFPVAMGDQKPDGEFLHTTLFGLVSLGIVDGYEERDRFDYYSVGVELNADDSLPTSYAGMSGGGLWQITIRRNGDEIEPVDKYLSGVVYYQTEIKDDFRFIKCHGRKSIYEYVLPELVI